LFVGFFRLINPVLSILFIPLQATVVWTRVRSTVDCYRFILVDIGLYSVQPPGLKPSNKQCRRCWYRGRVMCWCELCAAIVHRP